MTKITQLAGRVDTIGRTLEPEVEFHTDTIDRVVVGRIYPLGPGQEQRPIGPSVGAGESWA